MSEPWPCSPAFDKPGCGAHGLSLKPQRPEPLESPVIGIYIIAGFLAVIAALNFYEFGRFD